MILEEKQQLEREITRARLEVYFQLLENSVWERYKTLPTISTLASTLLIVATFNEKLLPITPFIRILLAILLLLIPTSLVSFLHALHKAQIHSQKKIAEITGDKNWKDKIKPELQNYIPWIITAIFSVVIVIVTFLILGGSFNLQ